ncbi:CHASE3 domain-containing protein [uncultured Zoogloea sp.]|uniref:sensor histidine kinase n=1 Tax=uncultured Zoogloea sp. TaxID=160237 RepID=UPI00260A4472|nr:CHASE3 domain-containing protein [uncultured Zoogloea sp.]
MPPSDRLPLRQQITRLLPHKLWSYLLVTTGCLAVISLLAFGRLHSEFGIEAMRSTQDYKARLDRIDALLVAVLNAETGVRGYLVSGRNPVYLDSYELSEKEVGPLLEKMSQDFPEGGPDRAEFEMLRGLVALKRSLLNESIRLGQPPPLISQGTGGPGKAYMDQIRTSIDALRARLEERNHQVVEESVRRLSSIQRTVTALAAGALGLIIALFAVQQRQAALRARIAELLKHENDVLESTVVQRTRELSDLASYLTDSREAEKARLAREMHDELGALLTAAKMDASWLLRSLGANSSPDIQARFRRLIDTIGSGITIKRRIIDDLRPPLLQGLGLVEALRAVSDDLRHEYELKLNLPDKDIHCPEQQALALFRIVQEAITNIRKYANAHHLELGLEVKGRDIHLWIADDGDGFDVASPTLNRHGLAGMKHRVQMFEGNFSLISAPGKGTRIDARMPLLDGPPPPESVHHQPVA